jgi:hypothetical protein
VIKRGKPTQNGRVKLSFSLPAGQIPGAVSVVGDFNGWDPYAHPMRLNGDAYEVIVTVAADQPVCFRYLADGGVWFDDDDADYHDVQGGHLYPVVGSDREEVPIQAGA